MATIAELREALTRMAAGSGRTSEDASSALLRALEETQAAGSTRNKPDRSEGSVVVELGDQFHSRTSRRRVWVTAAAAATVVFVLGLAVALSDADSPDDQVDTDVVSRPDGEERDDGAFTVTSTTEPVAPWGFEVELIEVDGFWSVDADETSAWGVPIAAIATPSPESDQLFRLDLATSAVASVIPIRPDGVFVAAGDDAVWVGHADGLLSRVDPLTETVVASIDVGGTPRWVDVGADSVWVAIGDRDGNGGRVVRVDPLTNTVRGEIETGDAWVVMEGAGGVWAWIPSNNTAIRIDPTTDAVVATVDLERQGLGFGVGPDAVWRAAGGSGEPGVVTRIDPQTNALGAPIEIEAPDGSQTRPTGAEVLAGSVWVPFDYACNTGGCLKGLARIDAATSTVVATESLPADPAFVIKVGPSTVWFATDGQLARVDI